MVYKIFERNISIPLDVSVKCMNNCCFFVGPKGKIERNFHHSLSVKFLKNKLCIFGDCKNIRKKDHVKILSLINTIYVLFKNDIYGVLNLFEKSLILKGIGYKAIYYEQSSLLKLSLGYSHTIDIRIPNEIIICVYDNTNIIVKGVSKYQVGQIASNIRGKRIPNVYKGNGIMYRDEKIKLKVAKKNK